MANGRCPSCQRDTREAKRSPFSKVTIRAGALLPDYCVHCGDPSVAHVTVLEARQDGGHGWPLRLVALVISPIWYAFAHRDFAGTRRELDIALPVCLACRDSRGAPKPTFTNFERHELTFVVHDRFAAALADLEDEPEDDGA